MVFFVKAGLQQASWEQKSEEGDPHFLKAWHVLHHIFEKNHAFNRAEIRLFHKNLRGEDSPYVTLLNHCCQRLWTSREIEIDGDLASQQGADIGEGPANRSGQQESNHFLLPTRFADPTGQEGTANEGLPVAQIFPRCVSHGKAEPVSFRGGDEP